jgi:probable F420-dependent oxidoreductase
MEYGIAFPSMDITDPGAIREFAQGAEALGYKQLSALEHTLGVRSSRDYNPDVTMHEPMVLFGYLAGLTKTIRFSNSILILPQRQTVLVARQAAEIDALSGGRMTLGVGIGSNADEAAGMGTEYHTRGARVEEQIELMRALWTQRELSFHGKWHDIENGGLMLLPVQQPIPLFMGGGHGPKPLERIGRLADGWIALGSAGPDVSSQIAAIKESSVAAGRSADAVAVQGRVSLITGSPEDWIERAQGWKNLGASHLVVNTGRGGLTSVGQHLELAERFMNDTAPKV